MKQSKFLLIGLILAAALIVWNHGTATTAEPTKVPQWDYKTVTYWEIGRLGGYVEKKRPNGTPTVPSDEEIEAGLKKLGEVGWELVHVHDRDTKFYFKKLKVA
jgi:hypothetical protein